MKHLPLLSLSLVAALVVGCSKPADEGAPEPTQATSLKRRTQKLEGVSLVELSLSPEVAAAIGEGMRVRAYQVELGGQAAPSLAELAGAGLEKGASDPAGLPWELKEEQDAEATRVALKFAEGLLPAIEAQVGTGEAPRAAHHHWWTEMLVGSCGYGDFYSVYFQQSGKLFVIEISGQTAC
jgi:hypothetical protein